MNNNPHFQFFKQPMPKLNPAALVVDELCPGIFTAILLYVIAVADGNFIRKVE
jgi:hypothetical protein